MKILTAQQMREIDRLTVQRCGISYATLMETAGSRVVEAILDRFGEAVIENRLFVVFCGKGNNGGDGAVIARLLWLKGALDVRVYLLGRLSETTGEARANFESIKKIADEETSRSLHRNLRFQEIESDDELEKVLKKPAGIFIDALLGTGLSRPAERLYARAIEGINHWGAHDFADVVSVDIPSGLASDQPHPIGPFVHADLTVTFTAPKIANVTCDNGSLI